MTAAALPSTPDPNGISPRSKPMLVLLSVLGALGGFFGMIFVDKALRRIHLSLHALGASDLLAVGLGLLSLLMAVLLLLFAVNRRWLGQSLEQDAAATPASSEEVHSFRLQALLLALTGVLLLVPVVIARLASTATQARSLFAAFALLLAFQSLINWRVWRCGDEFQRRIVLETGALSMHLGTALLFLWAVAERLSLVRPLSVWDANIALLTLYVAASCVMNVRSIRR